MEMQSLTPSSPPCIVWGLETQIGLNIVRELGRAGVRVVGVTHDPHAIGLRSRYLWKGLVLPKPRTPSFAAALVKLGDELGDCCLLAISEVNLSWLSEQRGLGRVRPVLPSQAALRAVLDKQVTLDLASRVGVQVPRTKQPRSQQDIQCIVESFDFPVVMKWSDPNAVAPLLQSRGIGFVKAEYAYTALEFMEISSRYSSIEAWPLVQEYCPGYGLGQFFYMHEGKAIRRFQHRRIAEWPPEGGFSSVCEAVPLSQHLELQEKSIQLLREIGWEGVAMVEYRFDPEERVARLMEINGRFWGSFPLAAHSGADFALLAYSLNSGIRGRMVGSVLRENLRCRMVATELKRLVRIFFEEKKIQDRSFKVRKVAELWRFVADFFKPNVRYYVWSIFDPVPFFVDVANALKKSLWK